MKRFIAAWTFLTIFPAPWRSADDGGDSLRASAVMFPLVGLALGLAAWLAACALTGLFPVGAAAAIGVALLAWFSGCLHLDGLADSADGLLGRRDPDKVLAVMKDSRVGAHGAAVLVLLLLAKYACLASLAPHDMPFALLVAPLAGRTAMLFPMAMLPYAREQGLGTLFAISRPARLLVGASVLVFVCLAAIRGFWEGAAGFGLWLVVALAWTAYLKRRIGGATGDCYGAACELGETAALLAFCLFQP